MDTILPKSEYLGMTDRPFNNPMVVGSHIFKIKINEIDSFIIVRENISGEKYFYTVSDSSKVAEGAKK